MTRWTVSRLLTWCESYLGSKGVEKPRLDAEILLAHCLGVDRIWLLTHQEEVVVSTLLEEFRQMIFRRARRKPVSRIIGQVAFYQETYQLTADVLVPRPETEFLVEGALKRLPDQWANFVDVGTGSGCVALSILKSAPQARGLALDFSWPALLVALKNAQQLDLLDRLSLLQADLLSSFCEKSVDMVVSNPPYINHVDLENLMPEVKEHDPLLALDGGVDGLDIYRRLFTNISGILKPGGFCGVEVGYGQAQIVTSLGVGAGLDHEETMYDYAGIPRTIWWRRPLVQPVIKH